MPKIPCSSTHRWSTTYILLTVLVLQLHSALAANHPQHNTPNTNTTAHHEAGLDFFYQPQELDDDEGAMDDNDDHIGSITPTHPTMRTLRSNERPRMMCIETTMCTHPACTPHSTLPLCTGTFVPCTTNPRMRCCNPTQLQLTCSSPPWPIPGVALGSAFGAFSDVCCCCTDMDTRTGGGRARAGDVLSVWCRLFLVMLLAHW